MRRLVYSTLPLHLLLCFFLDLICANDVAIVCPQPSELILFALEKIIPR